MAQLNQNTIDLQTILEMANNLPSSGADANNGISSFIRNTDIDHRFDETTGAYYTVIRVYRDKLDGTKQYPFVYAPNGIEAGSKSTYDMISDNTRFLAINGGIFNTATLKPDGILIQNGVVLQNAQSTTHPQCKPLTIDSNGNLSYANYDADADSLVSEGIVSAVCGFMPIIIDFDPVDDSAWNNVSHYTENAQRQIIGQFGNGDYAIITCEGRSYQNSDGWTIAEAQEVCVKLGLKFAYNLDGGGSTETMLGRKHMNTIYEGTTGRIVPTYIVFNGLSNFTCYTVKNDLNGVSTNNLLEFACENDSYIAKLSVSEGYTISVTITMGGIDITQEAYDGVGNINIPNVTGNIYIIASAVWGSTLPSGYTIKEYIEADGNQYADSLIPVADIETCGIEYKAAINLNNGEDGAGHVLSSAGWYTPFLRSYQGLKAKQLMVNRSGFENVVDYDFALDTAYVIKAFVDGSDSIYINNELICDVAAGSAGLSTTSNLYLFSYDASTKRFRFSGKIYYIKIYSATNEILYHFVPCTNSEGVAGLYEIINGRFFASATTTAFITHD